VGDGRVFIGGGGVKCEQQPSLACRSDGSLPQVPLHNLWVELKVAINIILKKDAD
jgi:hypothetical protein